MESSLRSGPKKIILGKRRSKGPAISNRVQLEKVLGLTVSSNAALACDGSSGLIAYPAGCVVVLLKKNRQTHIQSKKTITCLALSSDGRHLVTGESGYQPMVRVWDVEEKTQILEFPGHKFGINCVVFSPNQKYIVSIGSQHDMGVYVWNWRTNMKVASNKVASKVTGIAFSEDGSYFVTVGNRHVKFWYLDSSKSKVKEVVPLNGRSGILGDQKNNFFCGVACGQGAMASQTYVITQSGLLCEFNEKRLLDKWVEIRVENANCITASAQYIYAGCADGIIRVFSAATLNYMSSLPKPHCLGVDIAAGLNPSHLASPNPEARYPDCIAIAYEDANKKVTAIYNDHSMYVWDVTNLRKVGKSRSYMYHSACIWGVEMYPQVEQTKAALPPGSFITCSSDDTIRIWNIDPHMTSETVKRNIYSQELLKVIYIDKDLAKIRDVNFNPAGKNDKTDTQCLEKNGVRCIKVSPDGQHLASGDRMGNIRVHELQFMDQVQEVEAHDSEVLCLEFTRPETGVRLLASASRDRLIHVFDMNQKYGLVQTLDDHSSAITAIHFAEQDDQLHMLSCGADKSILFRTAQQDPEFGFVLNRHLVGRTTLYDMDIDVTHKFVATACQDRNVRIYNIKNGKQKKCYKGSVGDDGTLIKVQLDPSGGYVATSCSNKSLGIFDFFTGECMSTMFGHSELVTGVRFMNDLRHMISVAADGCIFVWRLPQEFTQHMTARMVELGKMTQDQLLNNHDIRRGTFAVPSQNVSITKPLSSFCGKDGLDFNQSHNNTFTTDKNDNSQIIDTNSKEPTTPKPAYNLSVGQLPAWAKKQTPQDTTTKPQEDTNSPVGPRGRWAQRMENQGVIMKSMLDENSAIQLSLADCMDRRRFTVEQEALSDQMRMLRRDTIIKGETKSVSVITDDDETNKDDEDEDDEFCNNNETDFKLDAKIAVSRSSTGDILEEADLEEEDDGDNDSTEKEVIYYLPNEESAESSEAIASSFKVFEGDTSTYKDGESEGTDPFSLSDEDSESPTPTTPGDPLEDFMSEAERDFEDLASCSSMKETFDQTLDDLEKQIAVGGMDPSRFFNSRLSISSRFISRAQTQHLRNMALQSGAGTNVMKGLHAPVRHRRLPSVPETGGWKALDEENVPEKDSPVSRSRPKLEPPPPPAPTRLTNREVTENRGRHSNEDSKDYRSRRSMGSTGQSGGQLSRQWKSMVDMSGRITPTMSKPSHPPRSKTPTSFRSTVPQRNHSPVRYVTRTEVKLESPTRARSSSTRDEDSKHASLSQPPRSKSATPLDNTGNNKRRSLPRQHSYQKHTESSNAKTSNGAPNPTGSPAKRASGRKSGKLNSALKSKFKSTPDLASALKNDDLKPMPTSKTTEDINEMTRQKSSMSKTVRRSMPAMREHKDPFSLSLAPIEPESSFKLSSSTGQSKSDRKVSIGESHVIIESSQPHRKLPIPGGTPNVPMPPSALSKSQPSQQKSSDKGEEDRLAMPPPPLPASRPPTTNSSEAFIKKAVNSKRPSIPELTLDQAKAILLGKSNSKDPITSEVTPLAEKMNTSQKIVRTTQIEIQQRPSPLRSTESEKTHLVDSSLDVPAEGSPDGDKVVPPGGSIFKHWDKHDAMPMDLPVKDQSPSKQSPRSGFATSTPMWKRNIGGLTAGRVSPFLGEQRGIGGEFDEAGQESDIADDGNVSGESSPQHSSPPFRRRESSLSPQRETSPSTGLGSPTRGRSHTGPRHIHRDESPLKFPKDFKVFTAEARMVETMPSEEEPDVAPIKGSVVGVPKSASMPSVKSDKALEDLCQTVTAKLDALANKPLPGRSSDPKKKKSSPVSTLERRSDGSSSTPITPTAAATTSPSQDGETDTSEIQRPDKSKTMPPTSLTTSLPATPSTSRVVLASPAPPDRSRLSLPVSKVNLKPFDSSSEPDDATCTQALEHLDQVLKRVLQLYKQVPKDKKQSEVLREGLAKSQQTLTQAIGPTTDGAAAAAALTPPSAGDKVIQEVAEQLSDRVVDILRAKLDQAL